MPHFLNMRCKAVIQVICTESLKARLQEGVDLTKVSAQQSSTICSPPGHGEDIVGAYITAIALVRLLDGLAAVTGYISRPLQRCTAPLYKGCAALNRGNCMYFITSISQMILGYKSRSSWLAIRPQRFYLTRGLEGWSSVYALHFGGDPPSIE